MRDTWGQICIDGSPRVGPNVFDSENSNTFATLVLKDSCKRLWNVLEMGMTIMKLGNLQTELCSQLVPHVVGQNSYPEL